MLTRGRDLLFPGRLHFLLAAPRNTRLNCPLPAMTLYPPFPRSSPAPAHCPYLVKPLPVSAPTEPDEPPPSAVTLHSSPCLNSLLPLPSPWGTAVAAMGLNAPILAAVSSTALALSAAGLGIALWSFHAPAAQAHANHCTTIKGTALATVTVAKLAVHLHCLRIEDNPQLETIDFSGVLPSSRLMHLTIRNNNNLENIDLTKTVNLTHLWIDNNDELEEIKFPTSNSLKYLYITNNHNLDKTNSGDLSDFSGLNCLVIKDNDNLTHISFPELRVLRCLTISNNKCLESIDLPKLFSVIRFQVNDNATLKEIDLSKLGNYMHFDISNNKILEEVSLPEGVDCLEEINSS